MNLINKIKELQHLYLSLNENIELKKCETNVSDSFDGYR